MHSAMGLLSFFRSETSISPSYYLQFTYIILKNNLAVIFPLSNSNSLVYFRNFFSKIHNWYKSSIAGPLWRKTRIPLPSLKGRFWQRGWSFRSLSWDLIRDLCPRRWPRLLPCHCCIHLGDRLNNPLLLIIN